MAWTKKHAEFCLKQKLRPSSTIMLHWILLRANNHNVCQIEIDLRLFNKWIAKKRGSAYDRKTIKEAIAQLDECTQGLVLISKEYTPWVKKLLVRPLSFVLENNCQKTGSIPKLKVGNPMYSDEHKKRANELLLQNISKLDKFLQSVGMRCNQETLHRMWRFSGKKMSEVKEAVKYMLRTHKEKLERSVSDFYSYAEAEEHMGKGITSPIGWLHDCLKHGRHINCDQVFELPHFDSILAISNFVDRLMPYKSRACQT